MADYYYVSIVGKTRRMKLLMLERFAKKFNTSRNYNILDYNPAYAICRNCKHLEDRMMYYSSEDCSKLPDKYILVNIGCNNLGEM